MWVTGRASECRVVDSQIIIIFVCAMSYLISITLLSLALTRQDISVKYNSRPQGKVMFPQASVC